MRRLLVSSRLRCPGFGSVFVGTKSVLVLKLYIIDALIEQRLCLVDDGFRS